jgi:hypothetical protein
VQLAIVSTRGNIIEAVTLDSGQLNALIGALSKAGTKADRDLMAALKDAEAEAGERYRQALARNPWMKPGREKRGLA